MARADLHCHTRFSKHPSEWFLQRIGTAESYTEPEFLYRTMMERGMDFVTVTDHNTMGGALELLARYPDRVIPGVEATAYFPEDRCKTHILIYGQNEAQFQIIDKLRENIYELRDYLRQERLACSVAHATYAVDGKLTASHLEKLILLFDVFEGINGARNRLHNEQLVGLLSSLDEKDIDRLYDRHRIEPFSATPWIKGFTGGSDDHAGIFLGRTWTEASASTAEAFIEALKDKNSMAHGRHNDFQSLTFSIYKIAFEFSKTRGSGAARTFFHTLNSYLFDRRQPDLLERIKLKLFKNSKESELNELLAGLFDMIGQVEEKLPGNLEKKLEHLYDQVGHISDRLVAMFIKKIQESLQKGDLSGVVKSISAALPGFFLSVPFITAFRHLFTNRKLVPEVAARLGKENLKREKRILWFTDTLNDLNGVSVTLKKLGWLCHESGRNMKLVTSLLPGEVNREISPNLINIPAVHHLPLPYYPKLMLKVPSILSALKEIYEYGPDEVYISSPGPIGLFGLFAAKLLDARSIAVYHTDFTLEAREIVKDDGIVNLVESYTRWFYQSADEIQTPTREYQDILSVRGFDRDRMKVFRRGLDTEMFKPKVSGLSLMKGQARNWKDGITLLYTGRISEDKGLGFLLDIYQELQKKYGTLNLVMAGEGPYLETLRDNARGMDRVLFLGRLANKELPEIYNRSDIFVFPSITDTFGMSVLEAQACGLPAVVSDQGGPREIIERGVTGLVARAMDRADWLEKLDGIVRLSITDPAAFENMKLAARARILKNHNWERVLDNIFETTSSSVRPAGRVMYPETGVRLSPVALIS